MSDPDSEAKTGNLATSDTVAEATTTPPSRAARLSLPGYEVGAQIGRGGMGEVLLAHDPDIGRDVAIKRIADGEPSSDDVARFLREARIQAQLEHPAIVPVHEIGHDANGNPFFTMKRLAGTTLLDVLREPSPDRARMLRALVDVCNAIELAHTRHVVHRDLKPANIMLGDFGEVYVLDWGVARMVDDAEHLSSPAIAAVSGQTEVGSMLGTLGYMAPEQIRDATSVGPAADVYSLGCILFEILAGEPAHPRGQEAIVSTLTGGAPSPAERCPDRNVPPELDAACTAALAEEPENRPTARALGDRIQRYLDGDRDLERRRRLSAEHLAIASAAIEDPARRAEATREAGRALALDPESAAAAALVARLLLEPPTQLPKDLERHLAAIDVGESQRSARAGMISLLLVSGIATPLILWLGVTSWPWFFALGSAVVMFSGFAYLQSRSHRPRNVLALLIGSMMCIGVARLISPFLIVPSVIMVTIMGIGQQAALIERRFVLVGLSALAFLAPIALETSGVLPPTFTIDAGHVTISSQMVRLGDTSTYAFLVVPNLLVIIAAALLGRSLAATRRKAQRDLEIRAWHMQRLLPG